MPLAVSPAACFVRTLLALTRLCLDQYVPFSDQLICLKSSTMWSLLDQVLPGQPASGGLPSPCYQSKFQNLMKNLADDAEMRSTRTLHVLFLFVSFTPFLRANFECLDTLPSGLSAQRRREKHLQIYFVHAHRAGQTPELASNALFSDRRELNCFPFAITFALYDGQLPLLPPVGLGGGIPGSAAWVPPPALC